MWEMIEPIFRGRFSPFRLLFLGFGVELMKKENENELTWRMVLIPNKGVEMKQLIKTAKQFFDLPSEDRDYTVEDLLNAWSQGTIDEWQLQHFFFIEGLSVNDVKKVREKCKANRHFRIVFDEYHLWTKDAARSVKRKLKDEALEKHTAKYLVDHPELLDDQNKNGLLPEIYSEMDEFRDQQGNEPA